MCRTRVLFALAAALIVSIGALAVPIPANGQTATPWTTPTAWRTPVPDEPATDAGTQGIFTSNRDWFQSIIDTITGYKKTATTIESQTRQTINTSVVQIGVYSPFKYFRGFLIMFQDFGWLMILAGWFVFALIVILVVAAIRLIISLWGIVQRILELVKAIPFV